LNFEKNDKLLLAILSTLKQNMAQKYLRDMLFFAKQKNACPHFASQSD